MRSRTLRLPRPGLALFSGILLVGCSPLQPGGRSGDEGQPGGDERAQADTDSPLPAGDLASPPPGDSGPTGNVIEIDGWASQYRIVPEESRLVVLVIMEERAVCNPLHSHVLEAKAYEVQFDIRDRDLPRAYFEVEITTADLDPDDPLLRTQFPETSGDVLTRSQRDDVYENAMKQLQADAYPTMTFRADALTTMVGEGEALVTYHIAGKTSSSRLPYEATVEPGRLVITGRSGINAGAHGMPTGFGANCTENRMPVDLTLVLEPVD